MFGKQVFAGQADGHREALGAFADKHYVPSVFHHCLGRQRDVLDVAHAADRSRPARGAMHATRVEFHDSFFVGQAAEADAVVVGIVFRTHHHADGSV